MAKEEKKEETPVVNNSVPYPPAPPVDLNDPNQEHYQGIRPETPKRQGPPTRRPWGDNE